MPLRPKQSLGQNFLRDPNTARKIVASLKATAETHVVEIGPGEGALTGFLLELYPRFTAIEIDERAVGLLREKFGNLDVRRQDVLKIDWKDLAAEKGAPIHVIGNLPYNITSQILFGVIDSAEVVREAVVMMQLEVAERLVAEPRTKAYGILSVQMQLFARPELLFKVPRTVFFPRPDVTSAVVRLEIEKPGTNLAGANREFLRAVVRTAFNQRRKTLHNSLGAWTRDRGIALPEDFEKRRPEELAPSEFVALTRYLEARL
jgi:16S rRNA (adenine1518-N6/adenine1519-N6)-dimethyltransferase